MTVMVIIKYEMCKSEDKKIKRIKILFINLIKTFINWKYIKEFSKIVLKIYFLKYLFW